MNDDFRYIHVRANRVNMARKGAQGTEAPAEATAGLVYSGGSCSNRTVACGLKNCQAAQSIGPPAAGYGGCYARANYGKCLRHKVGYEVRHLYNHARATQRMGPVIGELRRHGKSLGDT